MTEGMAPAGSPVAPATERINLVYHLIIGVAAGIVAPFTALAWPIALLVGLVIGMDQAERIRGVSNPAATSILRALLVVIGIGGMLFFGALVGGLIGLVIVALVAFSERIAARAADADRGIARILVFIVTAVIWLVVFFVLKPNINFSIG